MMILRCVASRKSEGVDDDENINVRMKKKKKKKRRETREDSRANDDWLPMNSTRGEMFNRSLSLSLSLCLANV